MSSSAENNKYEKLSNFITSQFDKISNLVENTTVNENMLSPEQFHVKIEKELKANHCSENSDFSVSKLTELFKSIDEVPSIIHKCRKVQISSRTNSTIMKEDLSESTQIITEDNLESVAEITEDFVKSKEQYEKFLRKIAINQKKIDYFYAEIQKLNSFIDDLQKLLPSESQKNPMVLNPQQEEQVKKFDRDINDYLYIQKNKNVYSQVDEHNNIAENLEIIVPIINELLQNITINL